MIDFLSYVIFGGKNSCLITLKNYFSIKKKLITSGIVDHRVNSNDFWLANIAKEQC